jgi:hypothetical protein
LTVDGGLISCTHTETIKKTAKDREQMVTVPRFEPGYLGSESLQHYQNSQLAPSYAYYKQGQVLFYVMQYIYIYIKRVKIWNGFTCVQAIYSVTSE